MSKLHCNYSKYSVHYFVKLYEDGLLNLKPEFQRDSVWKKPDRAKLIETILRGYPIPSIFLNKRYEKGVPTYDVIDGKQRLETIFMFQGLRGFSKKRFEVKTFIEQEENYLKTFNEEKWNWTKLKQKNCASHLTSYEIQTIEIEGNISEVIDIFVRINSTGKVLSSAEKRKAKYFNSGFLKEAETLAKKNHDYLSKLLKPTQVQRMKHIELVCELLVSLYEDRLIHKKKAVDNVIGSYNFDKRKLSKAIAVFTRTLNITKRIFPRIAETRFAKPVDFYTLFMTMHKLDSMGKVLHAHKRNIEAEKLLIGSSSGVDFVRERIRKGKPLNEGQQLFREYLQTVQEGTDTLNARQRREKILLQLFEGLFDDKDARRSFTAEQRRILWHSEERKVCMRCNEELSWDNFTIDHKIAHALGGRSNLSNAQLMCLSCNARKGRRRN